MESEDKTNQKKTDTSQSTIMKRAHIKTNIAIFSILYLDNLIACFFKRLIPPQYINYVNPQTPATPPPGPASPPQNPHTFHKTCLTSAAQSGVLLDSVNSPDGELNKSYTEALNDGETEVAKVSEQYCGHLRS